MEEKSAEEVREENVALLRTTPVAPSGLGLPANVSRQTSQALDIPIDIAVDDAKDSDDEYRGFNRIQLLHIFWILFFMGTQLTLPYTVSVYMVRDFFKGDGHTEQKIAQLAGLLAAGQSLSRTVSGYPWGMICDKLGRKVGVMVGVSASAISVIWFGYSTSYTAAIFSRAVPALFVGTPVAMKAMIGDACNSNGQAYAMGIFNLGHGTGSILGSMLGGVLGYPCDRFEGFPFCQEGQLFANRPFLLPSLAGALIGVIALLVSMIWMTETHPELIVAPGGWKGNLLRILCCRSTDYEKIGDEEIGTLYDGIFHPSKSMQNSDSPSAAKQEIRSRLESRPSLQRLSSQQLERRPSDIEMGQVDRGSIDPTKDRIPENNPWNEENQVRPEKEIPAGKEESNLEKHSMSDLNDKSASLGTDDPSYKWWKDNKVRKALIGSGLIALFFNFTDEISPVYVSAPVKQGGLAMPLKDFTWPLTASGGVLVLFSLFAFPKLTARFGSVTLARGGLLSAIPLVLMLPVSSVFRKSHLLEQVCVWISVGLGSLPKLAGYNSSMIIVNNTATSKTMGRLNGASVSLQSAGRAIGPLLSGSFWAISVSLHIWGQQFLPFIVIAISLFATQFIYAGMTEVD